MAKAAQLTLQIDGNITNGFRKSINEATKKIQTLNQRIKRSMVDAAGGATRGFKSVVNTDAYQAAAVAATGVGFAMAGAVKKAMDFEKSMQAVKAVSGATGAEFQNMSKLARELGRNTMFSASEASGAMEMLAMAGLNTNQILAATGPTLDLAAAGSIELAEAADIATNIMGGMSMKVSELGTINDVLAKTASSANTNITEMAEVFEKVSGVAPTMGMSLQQTAGMAGILADSGIKGAEAGTALRNTMLRIASEDKAQKALQKLSVASTDAQGNMREFPDILRDVGKSMRNLSEEQQAAVLKDIFGARAAAAGAILTQAAAEGTLQKKISTVADSEGAAAKMAKERSKGLAGSLKRLGSAMEGLAIAFGGPLLGPLASFAELIAGALQPISWMLENVPGLAPVIAGLGAAFVGIVVALPILAAVKGALLGLTGATTVLAGIKVLALALVAPLKFLALGFIKLAAMAVPALFSMAAAAWTLAAPFLPVIAAVAGVIAAVVLLVKFWPQISQAAGMALGWVTDRIKEFIGFAVTVVKNIAMAWWEGLKMIGGFIAKAVTLYIKAWKKIGGFIADLVGKIAGFFFSLPGKIFQAGVQAMQALWDGFKSLWSSFANWITSSLMDAIKNAVSLGWLQNLFGGGDGGGNGKIDTSDRQANRHGGARADGGPVSAGRSYLVGERGPELFIPNQSGLIASNAQLAAALRMPQPLADLPLPQAVAAVNNNRSASISLAPVVNVNVSEAGASAEAILMAVQNGIAEALAEAEADVRALLND